MVPKKNLNATKRRAEPERLQRGGVDRSVMVPVPPPGSDAPADYADWLAALKVRIRQERLGVVLASNAAMVVLNSVARGPQILRSTNRAALTLFSNSAASVPSG